MMDAERWHGPSLIRMFTIATATPDEQAATFERALAHLPDADRPGRVEYCLNLLETGIFDPRGLWIARVGSDVAAAQVCVPLAGAACLFWLPAERGAAAEAVAQAGIDWCRSWGCKLAQALARDDELLRAEPLVRRGFRAVTRLCHMERSLTDVPAKPISPLRFETYSPKNAAEFAVTLERTYEGTLDCPELNGMRSIDEIIAGHRGQGRFDPQCWWLAYDGARPAGVALLAEMPDAVTWELAYVGVVPEYRQRGIGRFLTLHALHALLTRPATRMTLVVDDRNAPARRLYTSLGFVETEISTVLLYFF
jgi:mycothiol synthase